MGRFPTEIDRAGGEELLNVAQHLGPPEALLEKRQSPIYPGVESELGGVSPIENLRPDKSGNKEAVVWAETRVLLLGPQDRPLNIPDY